MARHPQVLKSTLAEVYNGAAPGTVPRVMGPDSGACSRLTTTDSALLGEIIDRPQPPPLDVVTFHHYAMPKNSFTGQKYNVTGPPPLTAFLTFISHKDNSHSYTHLIRALGIVREPTVAGFITSKYIFDEK